MYIEVNDSIIDISNPYSNNLPQNKKKMIIRISSPLKSIFVSGVIFIVIGLEITMIYHKRYLFFIRSKCLITHSAVSFQTDFHYFSFL